MLFSETEILRSVADSLAARLPWTWQSELSQEASLGSRDRGVDASLVLTPPSGPTATLAIVVKSNLGWNQLARSIDREVRTVRPFGNGVLFIAPYISPTARKRFADQDISFADQTGNVRISLPQPPLFIELQGADRNPDQITRSLQSLRGRGAARAIRALCDFRPPYGIRGLAGRADASAPSLSRVVALLEGEQLLTRASERGEITEVPVRGVIEKWVQDYQFSKAHHTSLYIEPRGLSALADKLRKRDIQYAVTGSMASSLVAPTAPVRLAAVYVRSLLDAEALGLRRVDVGGNVVLATPFDPIVFERPMIRDGLTLAAPSQVAADLLTGPGRSPAEGEELLNWMEANEDDWRI